MEYHILALGDVTSETGVRHLARLRAAGAYPEMLWP